MANRVTTKKKKTAGKAAPAPKRSSSAKPVAALKPGASTLKDRAASARNDKELLYLYGISDKQTDVRVAEGVDGHSGVEAIECGGLVCWVSRVDAREFGAELQTRMENLDWLAGASVRHQRVVAAIHESTTVLPARFATLFLSRETLAAHVNDSKAQIRRDLDRVEGADEYGIKIFGAPKAELIPPAGSSGRDYLQRKSTMLKQVGKPAMTPQLEAFVDDVTRIAAESAPGGSVSGGQRNLVWQRSVLVPRKARQRLEAALAAVRERAQGYRIECTGPWPPYSFIAVKAERR